MSGSDPGSPPEEVRLPARSERSDRSDRAGSGRPVQEFLSRPTGGATLLLLAAVAASVWVNSPWSDAYDRLWQARFGFHLGGWGIELDLRHWVNDGLMTLFFLVVGLEIKRELLTGALRDRRTAGLPAIAAAGGMVVPALIYLALNAGGAGSRGWGIPMATDIAFALGVLTLAARHAPAGIRPFLLALAIVDDIGAVVVIALCYSGGVAWGWLGAAAAVALVILVLHRTGVRSAAITVALSLALWLATFGSGVHPAIAGVVLGLLTPALALPGTGAVSPLARLEHLLLPWTSLVILPLFALANAGVRLSSSALQDAVTGRVALGVILGLVLGKTVGISAATWAAVRLGVGRVPAGVGWSHIVGTAAVAGIGFTVSLFLTELAFDDAGLATQAKVGILSGSILAGTAGFLLLRRATHTESTPVER